MERIPTKTNPTMFDFAAQQIQNALGGLSWLDHVFGIVEKLTDVKDGKKFSSANLYKGNGKYEQIMPCKELGNFSYLILRDPQTIGKDTAIVKSPYSLIVWYNMDTLSSPYDERNREAVKAEILGILSRPNFSWLTMNRIYERPENIFADFSYDYTNNQFLMAPYAGLRIDGEMIVRVPCYVPPTPPPVPSDETTEG